MNVEDVKEHIRQWVKNTLSVPSPLFQNLPPCPYSREALLNNKVDIRCVHGSDLLECVAEMGRTWDDSHELILVAADPDTIEPEELIAAIGKSNELLETADLVSFFDHPRCTNPKYTVTSANGTYVLVGMQRLENFVRAAQPLYKKKYFEKVSKQFSVVDHLNKDDSGRR